MTVWLKHIDDSRRREKNGLTLLNTTSCKILCILLFYWQNHIYETMKKIRFIVPALLALAAGLMTSCSSESVDILGDEVHAVNMLLPERNIELTTDQRKMVDSNNIFARRLFRNICNQDKTKSTFCSPLSVTYLLGMLNAGAEGNTQKEILDVLGLGDNPQAVNEWCEKLLKEAPQLDSKVTLNIANSIFVNNKNGTIRTDYKEEMEKYYDAEVADMDFTNVRNVDVINNWASKKTDGMIPKILTDEEFKPSVVMFLLNAIFFKADWTQKFDEKYTKKENFNGINGTKQVEMMHQKLRVLYSENTAYSCISLPYGNGNFVMDIILPNEGVSVDDIVLHPELSDGIMNNGTYEVDVKIPRWDTDANIPLIPILKEMGIKQMFSADFAELTKMVNEGTLFVSMMKQMAKIEVNEKGSKAAAVTIAGGNYVTSVNPDKPEIKYAVFHANRPFLYTIRENGTDAIFFMGRYLGE